MHAGGSCVDGAAAAKLLLILVYRTARAYAKRARQSFVPCARRNPEHVAAAPDALLAQVFLSLTSMRKRNKNRESCVETQ